VLHVATYRRNDLDRVLKWIDDTGYGLTLGIHSRIQSFVDRVVHAARVGNIYVNRSMIGAVVGVQPFGGEGLSGTGPKAGGPHYLLRFATERTLTVNTAAVGGVTELLAR
jgi:RHH-type proline utilization regulon transcriptional repressor/proline dehydrogenase/delta 1-pyrroline-5-carboxylate dehydrogenase